MTIESQQVPERFEVPFGPSFTHRLAFTRDVLSDDQSVLAEVLEPSNDGPAKVQFWLDSHVAEARPDLSQRLRAFARSRPGRLSLSGNVQVVPGGEEVKNDIHIIERMLKVFHAAGLDRRSYVVVIGGGAVLDAVGFAAAIAHRGLRLVRLPTTTLGQADSGVGVKNAVNLFGKKNWIGTFAVPWAVINDTAMLRTLPDRDFVAGFSEAVKVSLLKDPALFARIGESAARIRRRDLSAALPVIKESALWHTRHITRGGDPFESREARPLDFGHWSAHRLEAITNFEVRHGEAVAIGLAIDTWYSSLALGLPRTDVDRVVRSLLDLGFSLGHPVLADPAPLFEGLEEFRQHLGGRLTLTMLRGVGDPIDVHEVDAVAMREAIARVRALGVNSGDSPTRQGKTSVPARPTSKA
ncbi:MAG: 3-dehydroquinate synthase [Isosphaeraceae bacterium]